MRSAADYEREHIPGSRLLPLEVLAERAGELPRAQLIVLICSVEPVAAVRSAASGWALQK